LLHDGDYADKGVCVGLHGIIAALLLHDYGWYGYIAAATSVAVFWGIFRRGWQAKAELTALNLHDQATFFAIVKTYPAYLGYVPMWITKGIVKLPFQVWHRRIQSGLIALLWTGHISALPVLLVLFLR
jgi:hypothetical protein